MMGKKEGENVAEMWRRLKVLQVCVINCGIQCVDGLPWPDCPVSRRLRQLKVIAENRHD